MTLVTPVSQRPVIASMRLPCFQWVHRAVTVQQKNTPQLLVPVHRVDNDYLSGHFQRGMLTTEGEDV